MSTCNNCVVKQIFFHEQDLMTLSHKRGTIVQREKCWKKLEYYGKVLANLMLKMRTVKKFLCSMPNTTGTRLGHGKILILQMRENFRNYTSMAIPLDTCWQALKDICDAYNNGLICK